MKIEATTEAQVKQIHEELDHLEEAIKISLESSETVMVVWTTKQDDHERVASSLVEKKRKIVQEAVHQMIPWASDQALEEMATRSTVKFNLFNTNQEGQA